MTIAVLGLRGFPNVQGGIETHCENLYPRLVKRGCQVLVFTRKPYVDLNTKTYKGVDLIPLVCPKSKFVEAFFHTLFGVLAARKCSPDVLHIHGIGPSLLVPLARLLGLKVVMTNHGPDYDRKKWGKMAKLVLRLGERLGSCWANKIICISDPIGNHIRNRFNRDVAIIPNGVNLPQRLETEDCLKQNGIVKGKYILSVGRLVPEKGFHDLIEAFNGIPENGWKLVIAGKADHEGQYSISLREMARKNSDIILTGFLTGKPLQELYSHAALFILTSYHEGLPIALLEALSYGLPCIASGIPANRNVELGAERFFEPGNIAEIRSKCLKFMNEPISEEQRAIQVNKISKEYDWEKVADKTFEVYREIGVKEYREAIRCNH